MTAGDEASPGVEVLRAVDLLEESREELAAGMVDSILKTVPQYEEHPDPSIVEDLARHVRENVDAFFKCARAGRVPDEADLHFVRGAVESRVAQGVPLDIVLHSFRVGQAYLWVWIVEWASREEIEPEVVISLALPAMQYTDRASSEFTETYVRLEQEQQASKSRAGSQVLDALIAGVRPPGRSVEAIKELFPIDPEGTYLVAVITSVPEEKTEAMRRALVLAGRSLPFRGAITHSTEGEMVGLLALDLAETRAGCDRIASRVSQAADLAGVSVRLGIGATCRGLSEVPAAHGEALAASTKAPAGGSIVMPELSSIGRITLMAAAYGQPERLIPSRLRGFIREDRERGGTLITTLLAYADNELNARRTAAALFLHPNTVLYRLRSIEDQTGIEIKQAPQLLDLLAAIRILSGPDGGPTPTETPGRVSPA